MTNSVTGDKLKPIHRGLIYILFWLVVLTGTGVWFERELRITQESLRFHTSLHAGLENHPKIAAKIGDIQAIIDRNTELIKNNTELIECNRDLIRELANQSGIKLEVPDIP